MATSPPLKLSPLGYAPRVLESIRLQRKWQTVTNMPA